LPAVLATVLIDPVTVPTSCPGIAIILWVKIKIGENYRCFFFTYDFPKNTYDFPHSPTIFLKSPIEKENLQKVKFYLKNKFFS